MSGMAQEIQQRIEQDGGAGLVPGSAETPPDANATPSAGTQNAETSQAQGPPETIPYARFKEVNDRLQNLSGYEELQNYGYDPDSLGRLAAFEAQYMTDPVGTVSRMIGDLDLPQELKDAFAEAANGAGSVPTSTPADGESAPEGGGTPSGTPQDPTQLPPNVLQAVRYVEQLQAREAEQASEQTLDAVISHWDKLDKEAGLDSPPRHIQLAAISAAAAGGGFTSIEQLGSMARQSIMDYRDQILGSAVQSGRPGGAPALPGSGPAAPSVPDFRDIKTASKQAIADIQAGRLPTIGGA